MGPRALVTPQIFRPGRRTAAKKKKKKNNELLRPPASFLLPALLS